MARNIWARADGYNELDPLLQKVASGRLSRRRFAQHALALGVSATAVAAGLPVYTRNPQDFEGFGDLLEVVALPT